MSLRNTPRRCEFAKEIDGASSVASVIDFSMETKPPLPPFTLENATQKVCGAEDVWNSRDPDRVAPVYTEDTQWRNRAEFPVGREQVRQFLQRKWVCAPEFLV